MKNRYIGLRIYNNFDWTVILCMLEKRGYLWASKDKPTRLFFNLSEGTIFIDPIAKTLTFSDIDALSRYCNYYIRMR